MNFSNFSSCKIKKTVFKNSELQEADFTACDLSGAVFDNCVLQRAVFDNTNLEKADFRTAVNYCIDPEKNRIKGAKFSIAGLPGLLGKYGIEIGAE